MEVLLFPLKKSSEILRRTSCVINTENRSRDGFGRVTAGQDFQFLHSCIVRKQTTSRSLRWFGTELGVPFLSCMCEGFLPRKEGMGLFTEKNPCINPK